MPQKALGSFFELGAEELDKLECNLDVLAHEVRSTYTEPTKNGSLTHACAFFFPTLFQPNTQSGKL